MVDNAVKFVYHLSLQCQELEMLVNLVCPDYSAEKLPNYGTSRMKLISDCVIEEWQSLETSGFVLTWMIVTFRFNMLYPSLYFTNQVTYL